MEWCQIPLLPPVSNDWLEPHGQQQPDNQRESRPAAWRQQPHHQREIEVITINDNTNNNEPAAPTTAPTPPLPDPGNSNIKLEVNPETIDIIDDEPPPVQACPEPPFDPPPLEPPTVVIDNDRSTRTQYKLQPCRQLNTKYHNDDLINKASNESISGFLTVDESEGALCQKYNGYDRHNEFLQNLDWKDSIAVLARDTTSFQTQQFFTAIEHHQDPITGDLDEFHPLALAAKANDANTPNWFQATMGSNSDGFWEAMWLEISTLQKWNAGNRCPSQRTFT